VGVRLRQSDIIHTYLILFLTDSLLLHPEISYVHPATIYLSDKYEAIHPPRTYRQYFAEFISAYLQYTAIHNAGSSVEDSTGCVFVYEGHVVSYGFYSFNSIYNPVPYTGLSFSFGLNLGEVLSPHNLSKFMNTFQAIRLYE
jgi:hypothetical protein